MTKNHILIKSVVLGVLLSLSPLAKAGSVDQVLVTYFNKLYPKSPCSIDDVQKTTFLYGYDQKQCLDRRTVAAEGQASGQYIYGFKAPCSDQESKTSLDAQVNSYCSQQIATKQRATESAQINQAVAAQNNAKSGNGGGSGGGSSAGQDLAAITPLVQTLASMNNNKNKQNNSSSEKKADTSGGNGSNSDSKAPTAAPNGSTNSTAAAPKITPPAEIPKASYTYDGPDGGKVVAMQDDKGNYTVTRFDQDGKPMADTAVKDVKPTDLQNTVGDKFGADPKTGKLSQPDTVKALNESPEPIKKAGAPAADGSVAAGEDEMLKKRHEAANSEDGALSKQLEAIQQKITAANGQIAPQATTTCTETMGQNPECTAGTPQFVINCVQQTLTELKADQQELTKDKISCSDSSAQAEKACSMVRSDKAQQVQQLMSVGATVLSKVTAASESCGTTSNLSKIAQGGMLAAQAACSAMKYRCDFSCAAAEKDLTKMKTKIEAAIAKCGASRLTTAPAAGAQVDAAFKEYSTMLATQLEPKSAVPAAITQCEAHKADMATMGLAALGFLSAAQDAQKCKEQLAAAAANGNGNSTSSMVSPNMTTAEYCAVPSNASSITCKCTANPSAEGCMGSLAGSGVALGKVGTGSGASAFASAKQNGLGDLKSLDKSPNVSSDLAPGANLSEGAREALGIGGAADGGSAGGGSSQAGAANSDKTKNSKAEEKEKKSFGFFSSIGSMLSGGKSPSTAAKAAIRGYEQDQAIKRKLASDQVRAEITTASGKSNFDKIKSAYKSNLNSFEQ